MEPYKETLALTPKEFIGKWVIARENTMHGNYYYMDVHDGGVTCFDTKVQAEAYLKANTHSSLEYFALQIESVTFPLCKIIFSMCQQSEKQLLKEAKQKSQS